MTKIKLIKRYKLSPITKDGYTSHRRLKVKKLSMIFVFTVDYDTNLITIENRNF